MLRRLWKPALASAVALSGCLLTTPAPAAPRAAAVPSGDYCAPTESLYGGGSYTYTDVQVCLHVGSYSDHSDDAVRVSTRNNTYYWGGAWYSASPDHPADWTGEGSFTKDGTEHWFGSHRTQVARELSDDTNQNPFSCGTYTVAFRFRQKGPYWTADGNDINLGERSYQISLPC
ncbi:MULTISPECIES: hypothetical protein [Streptomyces]|uniref:hypothetical protein n=1 Tax=Streptomyces TaxID=1883 RepID=UPI00163CD633|nr:MULTISPECIES: hypothetical protein [Streptomyces]MBC2879110.1 hypothetical protein [Streptomyces sp. TYQ1024]UBI35313.1 hypothetical protein K7I03_01780 [Streptomyces mobaraensis]UKW27904.1 hypothetical protein MCU78_01815 [Streptomyces sp. TYQ1024]